MKYGFLNKQIQENIPGLCKHAFHTSFRQPGQGSDVRGRRSIAVRLICGFEKANEGKVNCKKAGVCVLSFFLKKCARESYVCV